MTDFRRFNLKTLDDLRGDLDALNLELPISGNTGVLGEKVMVGGRELPNRFVIQPMEGVDGYCSSSGDLTPYLTSVDTIEALTGLNFLSSLDDTIEDGLESIIHTELWTN